MSSERITEAAGRPVPKEVQELAAKLKAARESRNEMAVLMTMGEILAALHSEIELAEGLGEISGRLFRALKAIERASSLDEAKRLAKTAREAEGLLS